MNNILKYTLISMLAFSFFGCKDYLDVNTDPNNPQDVSVDFILPGAQASVAATFGGSFHNLGGFWAQYYTQSPTASQYKKIDAYNLTTDFYNREWTEAYAGGLNDLEIIRTKSSADGDNAYYLIATLTQSFAMQMLADLYNDIPFTEAFKGVSDGVINPKFDNGADVYPILLARIDEAVARYQDGDMGKDPGSRDIIYGGDMDQWVRFANTLKLKMYMRMSYTSMANPAAVQALLTEDNFITENAEMTQFANEPGKQNPMYGVDVQFLKGVNQRASRTLLWVLDSFSDPRLGAIFTPSASGHRGNDQGDYDNLVVKGTDLSTPKYNALTPVYLMTVTEKDFLVAEAQVRYNGGAGAQAAYEAGIESSFALHGLSGASDLYGAGGFYEYVSGGAIETEIGQIMNQKWIALANVSNLEAFFEMNRTNYPPLSANAKGTPGGFFERTTSYTSVLPDGKTPRRLWVPEIEISRNNNAPGQVGNLYTKVWWDKK